jgi:acyl-CoA synthetase (AMP-forming)/AMP-acid ligase II
MIEALVAAPERPHFDISTLRIGWVLSNERRILEHVAGTLGIPGVMTGYGMTETTTVLTRNRWDDPLDVRISTQGYALPDIELRIVDPDTGREAPPGAPGEIWARGYCVTPGYYKMPLETAEAITADGWYRTKDQGSVDDGGRLTFLGRLGDSYKSRGFNISPAEIEAVLCLHPDVTAAAVVGVPDGTWGAVGYAFIEARAGTRPDTDAIQAFLAERLSSFKLPEAVIVLDALPVTAGTGKVQKFRLKEMAASARGQNQLAPSSSKTAAFAS